MRFDLVDLRLFLFVVEAASITNGAARAGMALASASERIRLMEESLGAPLLERHRRGVRPTPAGSALVHHAQLVSQQLERMRGELSEYADGLRGCVRLFANTTAASDRPDPTVPDTRRTCSRLGGATLPQVKPKA